MSRLHNPTPSSIIEPTEFEDKSDLVEYVPQHPMFAFQAAQEAAQQDVPDHLENYQEVAPFADVTK